MPKAPTGNGNGTQASQAALNTYKPIDLETASAVAFKEWVEELSKLPKPEGKLDIADGWHDVSPLKALDWWLRSGGNRNTHFATVKKYWRAFVAGEWKKTGQPLIFTESGKFQDGHHRTLASIAGNVSFTTYVVASVPDDPMLFAYLDNIKPRSLGDALFTAGINGQTKMLGEAIEIAWRAEHNALTVRDKQPPIIKITQPEGVIWAKANPKLVEAVHLVAGSFSKAAKIVGPGAAAFFAWKALDGICDVETLSDFMDPLGSGANLDDDSPTLALRNRLLRAEEDDVKVEKHQKLALTIKAFNLYLGGQTVGKKGLFLRDNERFPEIAMPTRQAAE